MSVYIIRFGELSLKSSRVRKRFLNLVEKNLRAGLFKEGINFSLRREHLRFWLSAPEEAEEVLRHTFGIKSFSPAEEVSWETEEELLEKAAQHFRPLVEGKTFGVRVRRVSGLRLSRTRIERELGARLFEASAGVNLEEPEVWCFLEIQPGVAWLFTESQEGPGGLPVGSEGPSLALLSGGFDSAVAAWMVMRRGSPVDFLFFNLGGPEHRRRAAAVANELSRWAGAHEPLFWEIDFREVIKAIRERVRPSYWNLVLKRAFWLAAREVVHREGYVAAVSGESVGQVSTQTLENLAAVSADLGILILRPVVGMDKEEIIALARKIGTASISEGLREYCDLAGPKPVTRSNLARLRPEADKITDVLQKAMESLSVSRVPVETGEDLSIDRIPPGAVVVDVRDPARYQAWHYPGALLVGIEEIEAGLFPKDKSKIYIFYCDAEAKSAAAAQAARRRGFKAYSFKGGTLALMKLQ